jgi:hypothetical protein
MNTPAAQVTVYQSGFINCGRQHHIIYCQTKVVELSLGALAFNICYLFGEAANIVWILWIISENDVASEIHFAASPNIKFMLWQPQWVKMLTSLAPAITNTKAKFFYWSQERILQPIYQFDLEPE